MPNVHVCKEHQAVAVAIARTEERLEHVDERMVRVEKCTETIQTAVTALQQSLWRFLGAIALLVFLLSLFGPIIAARILK